MLVWATNVTRMEDQLGPPPHRTPGGNLLIVGAGKPRLVELHGVLGERLFGPGVVVVGDQWLVDGLLAYRLNARFVLWDDRVHRSPVWARLQQLAGLVAVRPHYARTAPVREPGTAVSS